MVDDLGTGARRKVTECKKKYSSFDPYNGWCLFSVGYNDKEMVLDGQFSYDSSNQRALPFNVRIEEISGAMRVYVGANSEHDCIYSQVRKVYHFASQATTRSTACPST